MSLTTAVVEGQLETINNEIIRILDGFAGASACLTPTEAVDALRARFENVDELREQVRIFMGMMRTLADGDSHGAKVMREIRLPWMSELHEVLWQPGHVRAERMPASSERKLALLKGQKFEPLPWRKF